MAQRGRRALGAALETATQLIGGRITHELSEQEEERKFRQRLEELGIKVGMEAGQITPTFQGGRLTGFQPGLATVEGSTIEAQRQLRGITLPPVVAGPGGGMLTGDIGSEVLPGFEARTRPQVIQDLTPQVATDIRSQAQLRGVGGQQPVFERTRAGALKFVGLVPKGARLLNPLKEADQDIEEFVESGGQFGGGVSETGTAGGGGQDQRLVQRINQLRQQGMSDQQIAGFLREKGIDPSVYGL